nr:hypothetical protein CFP56_64099 [Quercus suber]
MLPGHLDHWSKSEENLALELYYNSQSAICSNGRISAPCNRYLLAEDDNRFGCELRQRVTAVRGGHCMNCILQKFAGRVILWRYRPVCRSTSLLASRACLTTTTY